MEVDEASWNKVGTAKKENYHISSQIEHHKLMMSKSARASEDGFFPLLQDGVVMKGRKMRQQERQRQSMSLSISLPPLK